MKRRIAMSVVLTEDEIKTLTEIQAKYNRSRSNLVECLLKLMAKNHKKGSQLFFMNELGTIKEPNHVRKKNDPLRDPSGRIPVEKP